LLSNVRNVAIAAVQLSFFGCRKT